MITSESTYLQRVLFHHRSAKLKQRFGPKMSRANGKGSDSSGNNMSSDAQIHAICTNYAKNHITTIHNQLYRATLSIQKGFSFHS